MRSRKKWFKIHIKDIYPKKLSHKLILFICLAVVALGIIVYDKGVRDKKDHKEDYKINNSVLKKSTSLKSCKPQDTRSVVLMASSRVYGNKDTNKINNTNNKNNAMDNKTPSKSKDTVKNKKLNNKNSNKKTEKTSIKKVIVIDPGHADRANLKKEPIAPNSSTLKIKDGGGATGISSKTPEYVIAMNVAKKLMTELQKKGFTVIMTKTKNSQSLGNVERAEIGNKNKAALVIRIHADSSDNCSANGASMLVPEKNKYTTAIYEKSKKYGQAILTSMIKEAGMHNRGIVYRNDLTGFNWSKVPVVLVEMGFMSNKKEDKLLNTSSYQDKIVKGLVNGVEKALK